MRESRARHRERERSNPVGVSKRGATASLHLRRTINWIASHSFARTIIDCRLPTADCRLPTADCRLPTADCRLSTADCPPPLVNILS
ncbi:MAG: hypothetical protein FJX04_01450 [Alphaproteobacteria bacterium]|nr:hypothetical protein [Alphaproteobacteria bacterium]